MIEATRSAAPTTPGPVTAPAAPLTQLEQQLQLLLDEATALIEAGRCVEAYRLLCPPLSALWTEARSTGRQDEVLAQARAHRLRELVMQDPFTQRAFDKPRGYAGDAVMMDMIYRSEAPAGTSALGQAIFAATTRAPMCLSVRYRRVLLRSLIDDVAAALPGGRMLSVASGHCRELEGSLVATPAFGGEFVALDQDPLSCAEVAASTVGQRVRVVNQGVRELMARGHSDLGQFDLIYSAGLYDYLSDGLARRLTSQLLSLLRPGGRLLIANFVPSGSARGYQELFMDWNLILRNEADMRLLCAAAGAEQASTFVDPHRNVVYAEMVAA